VIKIEKVDKYFGGQKVLDNIDLEVRAGEIYGVVGLSGAGKSTLIRCINLLERPDSGRIWVDGIDLTGLNRKELLRARQGIGMIFQSFNLMPRRTVAENIGFPLELAGVARPQTKARVKELMELVGLSEKAGSYPRQLSGGQQQRVAIARALANNPRVLLCDEPTSALDPVTADSILTLLDRINREFGLTIVLISHQIHVIRAVCQRMAVVNRGKVAEEGPVAEISTRPVSAIARDLLISEVAPEFLVPGSWRLSFAGEITKKPVLANLIRDTGLGFSILAGNIEKGQHPYGWLVVEVDGSLEQRERAQTLLEAQGVAVEVVKNAG